MLVSDLVTKALKLIGAIAKSEPPAPDEMQDAFEYLNDMLDSWAADRLTIYEVRRSAFPLVGGQQVYTIGAGGNFNVARPVYIQKAGILSLSNPAQPLELPIRILSSDEWASVAIKSVSTSLSWFLYYDYAFPLGNISLWPLPSVSTPQIALYLPAALSQFVAPTDTVSFPPGYAEALRFNLALRLAPEWGRPIDPVVALMAANSKALIERANERFQTLSMDSALLSSDGSPGIWNYLTGESYP